MDQPTPPPPREGALFEVPRVYDRPLGLEDGPRIVVRGFKLQGAVDRPERGLLVSEAQAILDAARASQPAQGFTINQLQEVAAKVGAYYREHGYILANAFIPEQQVSGGEVVVEVMEGRLSGVVVEGSKGYREDVLQRPFKDLIGVPLDKDSIESALLTLTSYPGITAFGVLGAGKEVGTTQLTLRVQEEERLRVETSVDNYGSQFAGEYRGQMTVTINDPLHRADRLQLVGLYGINSSGGGSHGAYGGIDYEIPLFSYKDSLRFLALSNAYTVGGAAVGIGSADSEGDTRVYEVGYRHDFARTRLGSANIGLAFNVKSAQFRAPPAVIYDDKLATTRLEGQLERIDTRFRGINRIAMSYTHGFNGVLGALEAYDPNAVGGASRLGASGEFNKIAVQMRRLQRLTTFTSLVVRLEGQYTSDPLLSLEQFSLGGPDSVRAYPVAEILAEKGGFASVELLAGAPGFATKPAFGGRTWGQVLQVSIFADYATGRLNTPLLPTQEASTELAGVGGSLQLNVPGKVFARLDVATPLTEQEASNGRDPQYFLRFGMTF